MSYRAKPVLDQNHKSNTPWQSADPRIVSNRPPTQRAAQRIDMQSASIAPSAQTKLRLKAFQFIEGRPAENEQPDGEDKENEGKARIAGTNETLERVRSQEPIKKPALTPTKGFLSTPATRLPLADLIGNGEDPLKRGAGLNLSPDEHIQWIHSRSPESKTSGTQRGTKRARSSSPASSSQQEQSNHFPHKQVSFDLQNLERSLKTPQADPAIDIWNKYTINTTTGDKVSSPRAQSLAQLINISSPRSPGKGQSSGSIGGLRRWASCGLEWPMSRPKRRKTGCGTALDRGKDMLDGRPTTDDPSTSSIKPSKVGLLVEKIQESLVRPLRCETPNAPSSSSPLPESRRNQLSITAPSWEDTSCAHNQRDDTTASNNRVAYSAMPFDEEHNRVDDGSSHFGSEDLDDSLLEAVEASDAAIASVPTGKSFSGNPEIQEEAMINFHEYPPDKGQASSTKPAVGPSFAEEDFDEFDEDEELFIADLENMASLPDGRPHYAAATQSVESSQYFECMSEPGGGREHAHQWPTSKVELSDDEFGGDDLDVEQFAAAEMAATQSLLSNTNDHSQAHSETKLRKIQRYLVISVAEGQYTDDGGRKHSEKVLLVQEGKTSLSKAITLRQSWFDTQCTPGSYVHVIGNFDRTGQCYIDDAQNMLILHPDHLISATVVADSFGCLRRAVLQDRVKATSAANPPQVYGHILHEIFQEALKANQWDDDFLGKLIENAVEKFIESIYEINLTMDQAIDHLRSKMPELQSWARTFVTESPGPDAVVNDRNGKKVTLSINKLLDVEEHVWSPTYGLKGNIDATVQVRMHDEEGERMLAVPFEVKTGRNSSNASHRAQTALYTLLMGDRYGVYFLTLSVNLTKTPVTDIEVAYGILYYLETSEISRIPAIRHELRHMIMQRNELACYIRQRLHLPPVLKDSHMCGKCYAKTPCLLYHKLSEDGDGETSGMKEKFDEVARHLSPVQQEFFKKWDSLLTKEESEMMKFKRELWTLLSTEREKVGRCFANVVLETESAHEQTDGSKINRFKYTFIKNKPASGFSFADSQITVGEPIVISDEKGHFALANGYVVNMKKRRISVAVDRRLHNARSRRPGFHAVINQDFAGVMEVGNQSQASPTPPDKEEEPILYRLDKDEFSNGMATVRNNLIQMMAQDVYHAHELRSLIVEEMPPRFKPSPSAYTLSGSLSQMNVNEDQEAAIKKVMSAQDYALVLGMPGTGKTTTIAHIIRALVAKGKSVLLTSYTHTAVDNILLKIRNDNIGILRLGAIAKIHPEVQEFAILGAQPRKTIEELRKAYHEPQVVATTCLGITHQIFNERIFDYCIVDEASQITLPVCLGPIRMAKTFILVGDHYQLPPLVQNKEAQAGGLDISLFKLLSDRHPSSVVTLEHQYRMCEDIMALSNELVYDGRLKCGNEAVANRSLHIPNFGALKTLHLHQHPLHSSSSDGIPPSIAHRSSSTNSISWLRDLIEPSRKVVFANTDPLIPHSREVTKGSRITNPTEVALTTIILSALLAVGIPAQDIGVITLYRSQLALLKQQASCLPCASGAIEMHTADRYQGRDKEVIILSLVRSNEQKNVGELAKDWRRMNVAFTRARTKLIVLGSKGTLVGDALLKRFLGMCDGRGWRYDLPVDAVEGLGLGLGLAEGTQMQVERGDGSPAKTQMARPAEEMSHGALASPKNKDPGSLLKPLHSSIGVGKGVKIPVKKGKLGNRILLKNRPVLADIVNEALGGYEVS